MKRCDRCGLVTDRQKTQCPECNGIVFSLVPDKSLNDLVGDICMRCNSPRLVGTIFCKRHTDAVPSPEHVRVYIPAKDDPVAGNHYKRVIKGTNIQMYDIINAWKLDFYEGTAITYIARSKHKNGGKDRLDDIRKAVVSLKELERILTTEQEEVKVNAETGSRGVDEGRRC